VRIDTQKAKEIKVLFSSLNAITIRNRQGDEVTNIPLKG
jgi:hypothetical protein